MEINQTSASIQIGLNKRIIIRLLTNQLLPGLRFPLGDIFVNNFILFSTLFFSNTFRYNTNKSYAVFD